ncbi:MAG TPA: methyl-accepting chemotaxis protein [Noviherbaspirillum sp.]|uniref:methyl-accepting chemotaxis protein n=1 Tax=Noviherbaspirillum sp. TaxID=1926288 RepID=UPI002B49D0F2|nr:methyl-accepting chemotaxis protein [Noviherbaspirillum sp.]HJV87661.1 methyl-accepting chemotaxis protein [Noviherbaspirillum sp.]
MKFANLKIGTRLALAFGAILALLVMITILGISRLAQVQSRLVSIASVNNVEVKLATVMRATVNDRMIALRNLALLTEMADMKPEVERIRHQEQLYADAERKLDRMFAENADTTAEEKAFLPRIKKTEAAILPLMAKAAELGLNDDAAGATKMLIKDVRPLQFEWVREINDLVTLEEKLSNEAEKSADAAYHNARLLMTILSVLAVVSGVLIAWYVTRGVTRPIHAAVQAAQTVAAGDLTGRIDVTTKDETGRLLKSLKDMNTSLVNIVTEVRRGTDAIATASGQIASGNLDLSSRTEQQASSLEETASSMEELTGTVKQNADNARQANMLAESASEIALKGGSVVSQVVETMGAINDSAKKIVDIIGVIDGIAFQTNILALNAAVEAARAGEQGRGFAVVASEVRNLAQRSAAAAKEIKALISDSVEKVDTGAKLVDQAGATMTEIVDSVKRVSDIISEITAASQEQTSGIEQINQAIAQMDQVTQQNAALVEEAAAASESLQNQADHLTEAVGVFKLDGMQLAVSPATTPASGARTRLPGAAPANARKARQPVQRLQAAAGQDWEEF